MTINKFGRLEEHRYRLSKWTWIPTLTLTTFGWTKSVRRHTKAEVEVLVDAFCDRGTGIGGRQAASARREPEIKRRSSLHFGLGPNIATMPADDPLYSCQSDPIAGELGGGVKSLERLKKTVGGAGIEARAVIAYEIDSPAVFAAGSELNAGARMR